ncbi:hypothetical protein M9Y10_017630 [Tritrichomonas musculus]|uniref:Uncharacterized protein n=1 Tax=Tritrichomonas musculus TaxID=1915356 RepID=A0ABR2HVR3_9EUKA
MTEAMVLKCTLKVSPKVNSTEKEVVDDILKDYFVCNGVDLVPVCDYDWVDYDYLIKILNNAADYLYRDGMVRHHIRGEMLYIVQKNKGKPQEWRMVGGINSKPYNALIRKVRKGSKNPIKEWNETSKRYNKYDEEREEEHRKWREEEEQRKQRDFDATMEVNDGVADYETPFYD